MTWSFYGEKTGNKTKCRINLLKKNDFFYFKQSFSWSYWEVCIFLRICLEEKEFLCDWEEKGKRRYKSKSQIDVLSSNFRTEARHLIRHHCLIKESLRRWYVGWLFISGVGWNVASMWEVNAHPTDNDLFGKPQSNEADLKRSSLYRRDCKPRWLRSNQTKCWFQIKGTTKLNLGHFGGSHQCDKPGPWTFF